MKLIFENWKMFLNEVTSVPQEHMAAFKDAIVKSNFWTLPHDIEEVDLVSDDTLSTPAVEALMDFLNEAAKKTNTDLYFLLTVTDEEEYALGPTSDFPGYPDNWLMRAAYTGPQKGFHVITMSFRPLSEDFETKEFNPSNLIKILSQTLNHELVHYYQLKKQAANKGISDEEAWEELLKDPKQLPQDDTRAGYLKLHNEIDAYAHEAAEQMLDKYSKQQVLDIIKNLSASDLDDYLNNYSDISSVVRDYLIVFKDNPKILNKFRKKLYQQAEKQTTDV